MGVDEPRVWRRSSTVAAGVDDDDALIREVCEATATPLRAQLQRWLEQLPPGGGVDPGYLARLVADYPARGGKLLRPTLCLAAARAFGATVEDAVATAASIELLHNALLVHDDIEDGSEQRRSAPTLHRLHGVPLALNAGDALGLLSLRPLRENAQRLGPRLAGRLYAETERMAWETTEGQALELGWRRDNRLDLDDEHYLTMVLKKTCWLTTIHPLRCGLLIGTRGRGAAPGPLAPQLDTLLRFGFFLGAAFQIQDDLLNLDPDTPTAYGKEADGDLLEGKRTLPLLQTWREANPADRDRLAAFLALPREGRDAEALAWVRTRVAAGSGLAHARCVAQAMAGAALYEFDHGIAPLLAAPAARGRDARFLRALATWVLRRGH